MTSFLKKFQLLKRKATGGNDAEHQDHRAQQDPREASRNQQQPSTSTQDPAFQRTSQLLPLLVKPPQQASMEGKKKQTPLVFPELMQQQQHRYSMDGNKQQVALPKLPAAKGKRSSPLLKKRPQDGTAPLLPELSDEQFRYLWDSRKLQRARSVKEAMEMMDEREVLDTILAHLRQPPPVRWAAAQHQRSGVNSGIIN